MKFKRRTMILVAVGLLAGGLVGYFTHTGKADLTGAVDAGRPAKMHPDYAGVTIPPNIAPLNFAIDEPGRQFCLRITGSGGKEIVVGSDDGRLDIPPGQWRRMLTGNAGKPVTLEVFARQGDGKWLRFTPFEQDIAREPIDSHLVYRLIPPIFNNSMDMGIYQRDLTGYAESVVFHTRQLKNNGCVNCHTFYRNQPDRMFLHVRLTSGEKAMVVLQDHKVYKRNISDGANKYPAAIGAWHPDGQSIAISMDRFVQFFHTTGPEPREVMEMDGSIALYNLSDRKISSTPALTDAKYITTYPCWAPDGKNLYYCRTPLLWTDKVNPAVNVYRQVRYELMRIGYDPATGRWGQARTVLALPDKSITQPRVSPDGKFLLFCLHDCGVFPTFRAESDLYMMDLRTGRYWRLDINSDQAESWHCWSSNGRWIVFSSRRIDGLLTRPFFSYVDADGNAAKPFLLPQKDGTFYDRCLDNYNVPELVSGPVDIDPREIERVLNQHETGQPPATITGATPRAGYAPQGASTPASLPAAGEQMPMGN